MCDEREDEKKEGNGTKNESKNTQQSLSYVYFVNICVILVLFVRNTL